MSPLAAYVVVMSSFMPIPNTTLPYSILFNSLAGYIYDSLLILTFINYVIIVIHLIRMKSGTTASETFKSEAKILLYAGIRFSLDAILSILFHYAYLPNTFVCNFIYQMGCDLNNMFVPPLLNLCLHSLRPDP
ncbi:hypothetical protein L596_026660 [Steinernema carpocapsae]|nr:hypothetical protein L596_026660 [Steinernema carpocapsae]